MASQDQTENKSTLEKAQEEIDTLLAQLPSGIDQKTLETGLQKIKEHLNLMSHHQYGG